MIMNIFQQKSLNNAQQPLTRMQKILENRDFFLPNELKMNALQQIQTLDFLSADFN